MTCINLRERFGDRYKIGHDEAAVTYAEQRDPWMQTLPCARAGLTVYPAGGEDLALECDTRPGIARRVAAIPGVRISQDGGWGGEMTFRFDVALFDQVAAIVHPRRRHQGRPMTEAEKAAFAERGKATLSKMRNERNASIEAQTAPEPIGR